MPPRWMVERECPDGLLRALEPTPAEVAAAAAWLASCYNDEHNRAMMTHEQEMSPAEVMAFYAQQQREGGRGFLLYLDGHLMGDADLRHIAAGCAEFAIMVGVRGMQGRGLGTRFGVLLHALAFEALSLQRIYVAIALKNLASQRLFEKLGYVPDDSPQARAFASEADEITMSVDRAQFMRAHGTALDQIRFVARTDSESF